MNYLIGDTPMIKINYEDNGYKGHIYAKLEYYNLTGSIKDRVIKYIIEKSINNGTLKHGMTLVEATSGNTGISLSAIGAYLKYPVHIFMPDWVSKERVDIMRLYGAFVTLVSKENGGFKKCIELANEFKINNNAFLTNQFNNRDNIDAHYFTTGVEIVNKIIPDVFVSGIGTGGTIMGVAKKLKEVNNNIKIYALEPFNMSLIKKNIIGSHKIEGIGDDFIPAIVDLKLIDDVILITDEEAISMSNKLASELGIGVGISSGANMLAAIRLNEMGYNNVVTIFADDFKKYLSTDLTKNKYKILNNINLIDFEIIN